MWICIRFLWPSEPLPWQDLSGCRFTKCLSRILWPPPLRTHAMETDVKCRAKPAKNDFKKRYAHKCKTVSVTGEIKFTQLNLTLRPPQMHSDVCFPLRRQRMECWSKVGQTARSSDEAWLAAKKRERKGFSPSLWEDGADRPTQRSRLVALSSKHVWSILNTVQSFAVRRPFCKNSYWRKRQ